MPPGGRLEDCAPLTNRFPPLTRRRAMTAERYGPTLPTGKYPVIDHALGSWPLVRPDDRYCYSSDSRTCTPGSECITGFQPVKFTIPRRNRRRYTAGFRPPGARGRGPRFPRHHRAPPVRGPGRIARGGTQARGLRTVLAPGRPDTGRAGPPSRKSGLEDPFLSGFLSGRTELSADRCVLPPRVRRPILGGGVQSHMGYHGEGGRRVAMRCQLEQGKAFHAIARNNSATVGKSGRPHA
jgi:hypothetical protein